MRSLSDYLDANAQHRRSARLSIHTTELLQQGGRSSKMKHRQERLLAEAREQISRQMAEIGKGMFTGEVSVELTVFAPTSGPLPSAPKSVKRYLDALEGHVYRNDRQVAHLSVIRFAPDHPYSRLRATVPVPGPSPEPRQTATAHFTVTPLRLYIADYDRGFSQGPDLRRRSWRSDAPDFFEDAWDDDRDYEDLSDLYDERHDDHHSRGPYRKPGGEFARTLRRYREDQIARLEAKRASDQKPGPGDRPGPRHDPGVAAALASLGIDDLPRRWELPGVLWLPLPTGSDWKSILRERMTDHRACWRTLPALFDLPLSLDIAIHGEGEHVKDIDNAAHAVLAAFEERYCADRRGTVVAYRAYRAQAADPGVRVMVMRDDRVQQLSTLLDVVREEAVSRGYEG